MEFLNQQTARNGLNNLKDDLDGQISAWPLRSTGEEGLLREARRMVGGKGGEGLLHGSPSGYGLEFPPDRGSLGSKFVIIPEDFNDETFQAALLSSRLVLCINFFKIYF